MHKLGHTRSVSRPDYLLQTPDTFVRTPLPCLTDAVAIVHVGATRGADFAQFTVEFQSGGLLSSSGLERFVYVLEGSLSLRAAGAEHEMHAGGFAYVPAMIDHTFRSSGESRAVVFEPGSLSPGVSSSETRVLVGREADCTPVALLGDPDLNVRALMPEGRAFRFAVNTMTYQPGATLSMVEVHVMEHGLLMLEGSGIYRLGADWHPVEAGDFIWMGPFCPQWFGALGKNPAKYLIYKDWNRHPIR